MAGHNIPLTAAIRAYPRVAHLAPASYRRQGAGTQLSDAVLLPGPARLCERGWFPAALTRTAGKATSVADVV